MKIPTEGTLLRVFVGESDRWQGRPLHEAIVTEARRSRPRGRNGVERPHRLRRPQPRAHGECSAPAPRIFL